MNLGLLNLHPVAVPLGNELAHAVSITLNHSVLVYVTVIKPGMTQLSEIIAIL